MRTIRVFCLAGALASILSASTLVFDNTGEFNLDPNGGDTNAGPDSIVTDGPLFDSFTSDVSGLLTGLDLGLSLDCELGLGGCGEGSFQVALYADTADTPDCLSEEPLLTVSDSSIPAAGIYQFTIPVSATLTAGTMYWIGLSGTATDAQWLYPSTDAWYADPSGIPGGFGVAGNYNLDTSVGTAFPDGPGVAGDGTGTPFLMSVTVTEESSTPEPSTSLLLAAGAGILALLRRLARRRTASAC